MTEKRAMTKKEIFLAMYEEVKDIACVITLEIQMPTGEVEFITNPNVVDKIEYIKKTYNDDLVHNGCKDIQILHAKFGCTTDTYDFGQAIGLMKAGGRVARKGWNGKNMFLYYVPASSYPPCTKIAEEAFNGEDVPYGAYIAMKTAQGNVVPWLASQTDMLAEDWVVVPDQE